MPLKDKYRICGSNGGDEGKKYHSPYYSSSALASLTLYPNTETVGKSDYLKLSMVSLRYRVPHAFS